jgi:hypothetical protein
MTENANKPGTSKRTTAILIGIAVLSPLGSCAACAYQATRKPKESVIEDVDQLWLALAGATIVAWIMLLKRFRWK